MVPIQKPAQQHAAILASLVVVFLGLLAAMSIRHGIVDWFASGPLIVFYALLLLNTFFSIRYFHPYEPARSSQQVLINIVLFTHYVFLVATFNHPIQFVGILLSLFTIATVKYIALRRAIGTDTTIERKIRVDLFTSVAAIVTIVGLLAGAIRLMCWLLALGNILANIYFLWIHPLYSQTVSTTRKAQKKKRKAPRKTKRLR